MILNSILLFMSVFLGLNELLPILHYQSPAKAESASERVINDLQYRVAFDLGSGKLKMQAAWVDPSQNRVVKIALTDEAVIPLSEAIQRDPNGNIPEQVIRQLNDSLSMMQKKAESEGNVSAYIGGATEAYRAANNGAEVLAQLSDRFHISMFLLSQNEEAVLGYGSLVAEGLMPDEKNVLVWEIGGASTQLSHKTDGVFEAFNLQNGKVPMKNYIIQEIQQKHSLTPNPIEAEEAVQAIGWVKGQFQDAPDWTRGNQTVLGIGAMFPGVQKGLGKSTFTKMELEQLIEKRLGKLDDDLSPNDTASVYMVSDLLFLYGVMDELEIDHVVCPNMQGPGSTSGLLIDESRWGK